MPFIGELPGHWYDAEKDKYFKIEPDSLATPTVKYTTSTVKRIAEDRCDAQLDEKAKRIRREATAPRALPPGNLAGVLLRREMGAYVAGAEVDVAAGLWAAELAHKGGVRMHDVVDLFVGGDKDTGLAAVFGVFERGEVRTSYFPADVDDEDVSRGMRATQYQGVDFRPRCTHMALGFNAMAYDERSDSMLFVGQRWDGELRACSIPARAAALPRRPTWNLSGQHGVDIPPLNPPHGTGYSANVCIATPASTDTAFLIGTTKGILQLDRSAQPSLSWVQAPVKTKRRAAKAARKEIFALDLLRSNPTRVLLAGGRCGQLCMVDLRAPDGEWASLDHPSSIAHIKAIDEHHVLAAGPKNAMAVYDTRYTMRSPHSSGSRAGNNNSTVPVLTFPEYRNASSIQIGLDVLLGPGYGSGLVAAAHDDGKVALFSVRDGCKLPCPALDGVNLARPSSVEVDGPAYLQSNAVVRSLTFQTLPEDQHASLFVAGRLRVEKFAFSRREEECVC